MATMIPSDIGEFETEEMVGVLQSSISKKIMVDIIPFGVIHKRVGPANERSQRACLRQGFGG